MIHMYEMYDQSGLKICRPKIYHQMLPPVLAQALHRAHLVGKADAEAEGNTAEHQHGKVDGSSTEPCSQHEEEAGADHRGLAAILAGADAGEDGGDHT